MLNFEEATLLRMLKFVPCLRAHQMMLSWAARILIVFPINLELKVKALSLNHEINLLNTMVYLK